jgi:hypothetical protein
VSDPKKNRPALKEELRGMANERRLELADQLDGIARALHSTGDHLAQEHQPRAGHFAEVASVRAQRIARFVRARDALDFVSEAADFARARPLLFLAGCTAAGLALGRFLRATPIEGASRGMEEPELDAGGGAPLAREPEPELARPVTSTRPALRRGNGHA